MDILNLTTHIIKKVPCNQIINQCIEIPSAIVKRAIKRRFLKITKNGVFNKEIKVNLFNWDWDTSQDRGFFIFHLPA